MFGRATIRLGIRPHSSKIYASVHETAVYSYLRVFFHFFVTRINVCFVMTSLHILQFYDLWLSCKRTKLKSEMNKSTLF